MKREHEARCIVLSGSHPDSRPKSMTEYLHSIAGPCRSSTLARSCTKVLVHLPFFGRRQEAETNVLQSCQYNIKDQKDQMRIGKLSLLFFSKTTTTTKNKPLRKPPTEQTGRTYSTRAHIEPVLLVAGTLVLATYRKAN